MSNAAKATIWRILAGYPIQPHKIKYYLERRDPDLEQKMQEVLIVYEEVNLQNKQKSGTEIYPSVITRHSQRKTEYQHILPLTFSLQILLQ
jgi:hypothetical protein